MTKPRIYIDTCPLIDAAKHGVGIALPEDRRKEHAYFRLLLDAARDGELEAFTSTLTVVECLHADGDMSEPVRKIFRSLLTSGQYIKLVAPDPFLAEKARDLRWIDGISLRGADYLHVASAIEMRCDEFVTTDERIRGQASKIRAKGLTVIRSSETTSLTEQRRQLVLLPESKVVSIHAKKQKR